MALLCEVCKTPLVGKQKKYCSKTCHSQSGNSKYQNYASQQERGLSRKLLFIRQKGGSCEMCGYSNNTAALCFHHLDPNQKLIKLDLRSFSNNSMEILSTEVSKCSLLCHNCHMELHHPEHNNALESPC